MPRVYYRGGLVPKGQTPPKVNIQGRVYQLPEPGDYIQLSEAEATILMSRYNIPNENFHPFTLDPNTARIAQPQRSPSQTRKFTRDELVAMLAELEEPDQPTKPAKRGRKKADDNEAVDEIATGDEEATSEEV